MLFLAAGRNKSAALELVCEAIELESMESAWTNCSRRVCFMRQVKGGQCGVGQDAHLTRHDHELCSSKPSFLYIFNADLCASLLT